MDPTGHKKVYLTPIELHPIIIIRSFHMINNYKMTGHKRLKHNVIYKVEATKYTA